MYYVVRYVIEFDYVTNTIGFFLKTLNFFLKKITIQNTSTSFAQRKDKNKIRL